MHFHCMFIIFFLLYVIRKTWGDYLFQITLNYIKSPLLITSYTCLYLLSNFFPITKGFLFVEIIISIIDKKYGANNRTPCIQKPSEYSRVETVARRIERRHREREKTSVEREKRSNVVTGAPTSSSPSSRLVSAPCLFLFFSSNPRRSFFFYIL